MDVTVTDRETAFSAMYEESYGAIYAYAARRVGDGAADEVAAETFLIAWRRAEALPDEPLPWLYGVARNVVLRHHEATGRRRRTHAALAHEARPAVTEDVPFDPELWEAWEQLRPDDRELLALIAWEELTVAEAAQVLGHSPSVVSVRLHRARRRLQRLLSSTPASRASQLTEAPR